ncbi:MAG: hypothetical protein ACK5L2_22005, partial [Planctomyces sp.]
MSVFSFQFGAFIFAALRRRGVAGCVSPSLPTPLPLRGRGEDLQASRGRQSAGEAAVALHFRAVWALVVCWGDLP